MYNICDISFILGDNDHESYDTSWFYGANSSWSHNVYFGNRQPA